MSLLHGPCSGLYPPRTLAQPRTVSGAQVRYLVSPRFTPAVHLEWGVTIGRTAQTDLTLCTCNPSPEATRIHNPNLEHLRLTDALSNSPTTRSEEHTSELQS